MSCTQKAHTKFRKLLSGTLAFIFLITFAVPPQYVQAQTILNLPAPGTMIGPSIAYTPAIVAGMTLHPDNPLQFDFIIDTGDDNLQGDALKNESKKLINYFLATLTVPEDEMWVNLSPYEKDRIIANGLSQTEMGRDMLAQDYILKQLTASLMYPEEQLGEKFWAKVYEKAQAKYGNVNIPTNTFNKIWIVPEQALVYVHENNVFVAKSHLKVMLEQDYVALANQKASAESRAPARGVATETNQESVKHGVGEVGEKEMQPLTGETAEVVREVLIPEIEREVNEGKNFANLRQIYNSMILAVWYKKNLKDSLLGQVYMNKNKVTGIDLEDKQVKEKIYNQYVEAFKKGVYDYIKEDYDSVTQTVIPRKYFSGGLTGVDAAMIGESNQAPASMTDHLQKEAELDRLASASIGFDLSRNDGEMINSTEAQGVNPVRVEAIVGGFETIDQDNAMLGKASLGAAILAAALTPQTVMAGVDLTPKNVYTIQQEVTPDQRRMVAVAEYQNAMRKLSQHVQSYNALIGQVNQGKGEEAKPGLISLSETVKADIQRFEGNDSINAVLKGEIPGIQVKGNVLRDLRGIESNLETAIASIEVQTAFQKFEAHQKRFKNLADLLNQGKGSQAKEGLINLSKDVNSDIESFEGNARLQAALAGKVPGIKVQGNVVDELKKFRDFVKSIISGMESGGSFKIEVKAPDRAMLGVKWILDQSANSVDSHYAIPFMSRFMLFLNRANDMRLSPAGKELKSKLSGRIRKGELFYGDQQVMKSRGIFAAKMIYDPINGNGLYIQRFDHTYLLKTNDGIFKIDELRPGTPHGEYEVQKINSEITNSLSSDSFGAFISQMEWKGKKVTRLIGPSAIDKLKRMRDSDIVYLPGGKISNADATQRYNYADRNGDFYQGVVYVIGDGEAVLLDPNPQQTMSEDHDRAIKRATESFADHAMIAEQVSFEGFREAVRDGRINKGSLLVIQFNNGQRAAERVRYTRTGVEGRKPYIAGQRNDESFPRKFYRADIDRITINADHAMLAAEVQLKTVIDAVEKGIIKTEDHANDYAETLTLFSRDSLLEMNDMLDDLIAQREITLEVRKAVEDVISRAISKKRAERGNTQASSNSAHPDRAMLVNHPSDIRTADAVSAKTAKELSDNLTRALISGKMELMKSSRDMFVFIELMLRGNAQAVVAAQEFGRKLPGDYDVSQNSGEALIRWLYSRGALRYVSGSEVPADSAMVGGKKEEVGGIDFNANMMKLQQQGEAPKLDFSNFKLNVDPGTVSGIVPVIINITPVTNLPLLLGMVDKTEKEQLSKLN